MHWRGWSGPVEADRVGPRLGGAGKARRTTRLMGCGRRFAAHLLLRYNPLMRHALFLLAALLAGCCTSDRCVAVTTANFLHTSGVAAAEALRIGCSERYKQSDSLPQIAELDKPCLPAKAAYVTLEKTEARLVALLAALAEGKVLEAALAAAREAASELAEKIAEVPR